MPIENAGDPKCATPTIKIENGFLKFECATDGVKYHFNVKGFGDMDFTYNPATDNLDVVQLPTVTISVYASKEGYSLSDTATKIVKFSDIGGQKGDLNGDGEVNVSDHVELSKIIMDQGSYGSE